MPAKKGTPPISITHPDLAQEADGWNPSAYTAGSNIKAGWICVRGHRWKAVIASRCLSKRGCPYCSNQKILVGFNDLKSVYPDIATNALGWDPSLVGSGSGKKLTWRCNEGHTWEARVVDRTTKSYGCPVCTGKKTEPGFNDLETTHPEIAKESDGWDPRKFTAGSNQKKNWKCAQNHKWSSAISDRTRGQGCPVCSGNKVQQGFNDLETTHPELASQAYGWDPTKLSRGTHQDLQWRCSKYGHIFTATVKDRTTDLSGCPICSNHQLLVGFNDLKTTHPDLAKESNGWDPTTLVAGSRQKVSWRCSEGHIWSASPTSRSRLQSGCPSCASSGYDPNNSGYLYFLVQSEWEMYQIGITNNLQRRMSEHQKNNWQLLEVRGPIDGYLAQQWERAILRMLKAKGADLANSKIAGKFDGYSEAWSKSTFETKSIKELMRLTEMFEENQGKNSNR